MLIVRAARRWRPEGRNKVEKAKRDNMMSELTKEERGEYRQALREIADEAKSLGGHQIERRKQVLASRAAGLGGKSLLALESVFEKDQVGPNEGETPPDFELKRLGSDDRIRLSSFQGKRPVALVFGRYTLPPFRAQLGRME